MKPTGHCVGRCLFLSLLLVAGRGWVYSDNPEDVVRTYCTLDAQGARLTQGNPEFWALRDSTEEDAEPGWDTVTLIAGYTVGTARITGNTAVVPVTFRTLGSLAETFSSNPQQVQVEFQLIRRAEGWKIRHDAREPMVTTPTVQDHFLKMRWWFNLPEEKQRVRKMLYEVFRAMLVEQTVTR